MLPRSAVSLKEVFTLAEITERRNFFGATELLVELVRSNFLLSESVRERKIVSSDIQVLPNNLL